MNQEMLNSRFRYFSIREDTAVVVKIVVAFSRFMPL
jgi:hypothetical protein